MKKLLSQKTNSEDEPDTDSNGTKRWFKNEELHRDGNQPAAIFANGRKCWFKNGELHRDNNQPAVILSNGSKRWFKNGKQYKPE